VIPQSRKLRTLVIFLALLVIGAFLIRVIPIYSQVFLPDGSVVFTTNDAYWHMRLIDNIVANFPHLNQIDPYQSLSSGELLGRVHLFDWGIAGIAWLIGFGHPSPFLVDTIAALAPPVLGALTLIPVFTIGATLFAPWVGLLSAALVSVMPGEFLGRSILGSTDVHVAESFLVATIMCLLVLSVKHTGITDRRKPLLLSLIAGLFYSFYLLTWVGALGVGFLVTVFFALWIIMCHLRGWSVTGPTKTGVTFFVAPVLVTWVFTLTTSARILALAAIALFVLFGLSWLFRRRGVAVALYPVAVASLAVIVATAVKLVSPSTLTGVLGNFNQLVPSGYAMVSEMQPLFSPMGMFTWRFAWLNYGMTLWLGLIGLLYAIVRCASRNNRQAGDRCSGNPALLLLALWSLLMLLAVIAQRRYGYYFTVNIALLTGCAVWLLYKGFLRLSGSHSVTVPIAIGVVCVLLVSVSIAPCIRLVSTNTFTVPVGWQSSLKWLRYNSPEPFGSDDFYYKPYTKPPAGTSYEFPDAAYAVTAWTDYGYWITRIAHRIPNDNPGHLPFPSLELFRLLTADNNADVSRLEGELNTGYIVLDYATVLSKLPAILSYYGESSDKYGGVFQVKDSTGAVKNVRLFYPDYYHTLMVRLFTFDGKPVIPSKTFVVSLQSSNVAQAWSFDKYDAAVMFLASNPGTVIVGANPFSSPVPLDAVPNHHLVYEYSGSNVTEAVKVFAVSP